MRRPLRATWMAMALGVLLGTAPGWAEELKVGAVGTLSGGGTEWGLCIACGLVGLQGSLLAHYITFIAPGSYTFNESLNLAWCAPSWTAARRCWPTATRASASTHPTTSWCGRTTRSGSPIPTTGS
jgi:hypothetical protein